MSNIAIRVENLSKRYRIGLKEEMHDTLGGAMISWIKSPLENYRRLRSLTTFDDEESVKTLERSNVPTFKRSNEKDVIWALKDVSFEVKQGEVVGIIGRNGAGKSTLLKILSRITEPTSGRVELRGRVSSLLEVGTGFHPELTGRENIYLNGSILGMTKAEIDKKFDEIVDFSGVEKFIDTPVKRYSSGMRVRLAFSVAAHLEPEILLVDEVLAVGDAEFQKKCLGKMGEVAKEGRTVLFVSHQMDMIRGLCDRCILLNQGQIWSDGDPEKVIEDYIGSFSSQSKADSFEVDEDTSFALQIMRGQVMDETGQTRHRFDVFERIVLEVEYVVRKPVQGAIVNFELKRNGATLFMSFDSDTDPRKLEAREPGIYRCHIELPCPLLKPGRYSLSTHTGIANITKAQRLEDILVFDVELLSKPSAFLSYAEKRRGVIAVPLVWQTEVVNGDY